MTNSTMETMKLHTKTTPTGLRLQAVEMPGTSAVTALILVGAGSRHETTDIAGISHFLEHLFFKGAKKYTTSKAVSEAIDSVGGEFNAFTGKEAVGYYVKAGKQHLPLALDVLSDMLLYSRFPEEEIDKERGVILEEMAMYLDTPIYQISWDFESIVFGDQPLGRDQIGTREFINAATRKHFIDYKESLYTPDNIVITIAGAVTEKDLDLLEKTFPFQDMRKSRSYDAFDPAKAAKKYNVRAKNTEQYHISVGMQAFPQSDARYPALEVLATALGGNMSSRMFQNVREQKGLCYSIRTAANCLTDAGMLTTGAGVKLSDVTRALEAIREEYDRAQAEGIGMDEVEKAKSYLLGKIDLSTENTEEVAYFFGENALLYGKQETLEDEKKKIAAVTKADVDALARELFTPTAYRLAVIGPALEEKNFLPIIS
jgi:predicted Zn-dependent peptidase